MNRITIIGIDIATRPTRVGLALGSYDDGNGKIDHVAIGTKQPRLHEIVGEWILQYSPCLIAMDAPLGWPEQLGSSLVHHRAGGEIDASARTLFRRETDRVIHKTMGKLPLEVGASWISHTALTALDLLQHLREYVKQSIPLAWEPGKLSQTSVIEVYPAATLISRELNPYGYKGKEGLAARLLLCQHLRKHLDITKTSLIEINDDALDAVICALAAVDFLTGEVIRPTNIDLAQKESWIWTKRKDIYD